MKGTGEIAWYEINNGQYTQQNQTEYISVRRRDIHSVPILLVLFAGNQLETQVCGQVYSGCVAKIYL